MFRPRSTIPLAMLCLSCLLAGAMMGCSSPPVQPYVGTEPRDQVIYVVAGGWHTELALPMSAIGGPLVALKPSFANAKYLVFGWGARDYYMARDPGLDDLLRAAVPGPAVMLVIPLQVSPEMFAGPGKTFAVTASRAGAARLWQFLWDYLAKGTEGGLQRIGAGPHPGSVFYASSGTFDLTHTCNTWTAEALRAAGLPVSSAGVVYPDQLLDQLPPSAAPTRAVGAGAAALSNGPLPSPYSAGSRFQVQG
jgi:uncharacterized protein (TIGR02117 family)